ncbi:hypothetical protein L6R50_27810 [Myxococcota bacterium]|nr:hypothetical protein [Myxococcota bacterium]
MTPDPRLAPLALLAVLGLACVTRGARGELAVEPESVDLGLGFPGEATFVRLEAANVGEGYLQISEVRFDEDADGAATATTSGWGPPLLLAPGTSVPVDVAVAWPEAGSLEVRLRIVAAVPETFAGGGFPGAGTTEDGRDALAGRSEVVAVLRGEVVASEGGEAGRR